MGLFVCMWEPKCLGKELIQIHYKVYDSGGDESWAGRWEIPEYPMARGNPALKRYYLEVGLAFRALCCGLSCTGIL